MARGDPIGLIIPLSLSLSLSLSPGVSHSLARCLRPGQLWLEGSAQLLGEMHLCLRTAPCQRSSQPQASQPDKQAKAQPASHAKPARSQASQKPSQPGQPSQSGQAGQKPSEPSEPGSQSARQPASQSASHDDALHEDRDLDHGEVLGRSLPRARRGGAWAAERHPRDAPHGHHI